MIRTFCTAVLEARSADCAQFHHMDPGVVIVGFIALSKRAQLSGGKFATVILPNGRKS